MFITYIKCLPHCAVRISQWKMVVKKRTNLSASLHSSTTSVLSLHCLQCRALHLGSCCLSYHLLQIGITITAIINLRSQHLCSLSSTSGPSWKIGQALKSALFHCFVLFFSLPACLLFLCSPSLSFPGLFSSPFPVLLIPSLFRHSSNLSFF